MRPHIHLVEPRGQGGIYQHTIALANQVAGRTAVVIHTAVDAEEVGVEPGVRLCRCVHAYRSGPRALRGFLTRIRFALISAPHVFRASRAGGVIHVQGALWPVLEAATILIARLLGRPVVYTPHNVFLRRGGRIARWAHARAIRGALAVIVFADSDVQPVAENGGQAIKSPLAIATPHVDQELVSAWRERWLSVAPGPVVLFAGQLRPDKRLDIAIEAAGLSTAGILAVVGDDRGGYWNAGEYERLARERAVPVAWHLEYHPLSSFVAAFAAADVVVCPYDRASQSAILAIANAVGTPSVATDVGGLAEIADLTAAAGDVPGFAAAIDLSLRAAVGGPRVPDMVESHWSTYERLLRDGSSHVALAQAIR